VADTSSAIRPYLDAAFTRVSLDPQPIIETNAIQGELADPPIGLP
jgi:hypothetical protein